MPDRTDAYDELRNAIAGRDYHFLVLGGNVFDYAYLDGMRNAFDSVEDFLKQFSAPKDGENRFPNLIEYDVSRGLKIIRGDETALRRAMGLPVPEDEQQNRPAAGGQQTDHAEVRANIRAMAAAGMPTHTMTNALTRDGLNRATADRLVREETGRGAFGQQQAGNGPAAPADIDAAFNEAFGQVGGNGGGQDENELPKDPVEAFEAVDRLLTKGDARRLGRTIFLVRYADCMVGGSQSGDLDSPASQIRIFLEDWSRDTRIRRRGHKIVMVDRKLTGVEEVAPDGCALFIRFPKPTRKLIRGFLGTRDLDEDKCAAVARASSGLSLRSVERILGGRRSQRDTIDDLLDRTFAAKRKMLEADYGELIRVVEPRFGFDVVAGLEPIVEELEYYADAMRTGNYIVVPQGILFQGPPGTGKTLLAECYAKRAGVNMITPSDLKSKWLGDSEKNATRFLHAVHDLAPVLVWIDEFDQNQSQRGGFDGDSGVSKMLFKKMLEALDDTSMRGRILWLFATNRPDLIDPAMKRPGRCDLRLPLLPADETLLAKIAAKAHLQYPEAIERGLTFAVEGFDAWLPYVRPGGLHENWKGAPNYSGADMVEIVRRACSFTLRSGQTEVSDESIRRAFETYRPQKGNELEHAFMTLAAINETSDTRFYPPPEEMVRILRRCKAMRESAMLNNYDPTKNVTMEGELQLMREQMRMR